MVDVMVWTYAVFLVVSLGLTIFVAQTLHRNGRIFLVDSFSGNEKLADSVNHLLVVGFYLLNLGYAMMALSYGKKPHTVDEAIEFLSFKIGLVLLVLGATHLFNMSILAKLGTSASIIDFTAPNDDLAAFGSLLQPTSISIGKNSPRTNLIYANGLIVEKQYAQLGLGKEFLRLAALDVDIVLGHTQNIKILKAFRKVFPYVWPSDQRERLKPEFAEALAELPLDLRPR